MLLLVSRIRLGVPSLLWKVEPASLPRDRSTYQVFCDLAGHTENGQTGTITITP